MKFFLNKIFFSLLLLLSTLSYGQKDSIEKRNLFKVNTSAYFGISDGRSVAGEWYRPSNSAGLAAKFGVSLFDGLWLNAGVTYEWFRYRSSPFTYWGIERFSERNMASLTFPLTLEYSSPKRIGWYAETGLSFGLNQKDEQINRRVDNNTIIYWSSPVIHAIDASFSNYSLFLKASSGFQLRKDVCVYKFGLAYDHALANYDYNFWQRGIYALRFEVAVQREFNGNRFRKASKRTFDKRLKRKNYAYLELLGNSFLNYSLNYERSILAKDNVRFNTRLGGAIGSGGEDDELSSVILMGGLYSFGRVYSIELGSNVAYFSVFDGTMESNQIAVIPTLGFRFEHERGVFLRLNFSPQLFIRDSADERIFLPYPGMSMGWHF